MIDHNQESCPTTLSGAQNSKPTLSFATLVKSMTQLKSSRMRPAPVNRNIQESPRKCEESLSDSSSEKCSDNKENICQSEKR